jgi:hypothetical protein
MLSLDTVDIMTTAGERSGEKSILRTARSTPMPSILDNQTSINTMSGWFLAIRESASSPLDASSMWR